MTFPYKTLSVVLFPIILAVLLAPAYSPAAENHAIQWENDLEKAKQRAAAENKPLLLHFYGDHCPPCRLMEKDYFPNAGVIEKLNSEFVAIKINTTQQPQLMAPYGVRGVPTDIYLSPNGEKLHSRTGIGETVGILQPSDLIAEMTRIVAKVPKPAVAETQHIVQNQTHNVQNMTATQNFVTPQTPGIAPTVSQPNFSQQNAIGYAFVTSQNPSLEGSKPTEEMEGFAVSGKTVVPASQNAVNFEDRMIMPTQYAVPQNTVAQNTASQMFQPQHTEQQQIAQTQVGPYQFVQSQPQPQPEPLHPVASTMQPAEATPGTFVPNMPTPEMGTVSTFVSNAATQNSVTPGSFDTGIVRKQPNTGLGAGLSLGVLTSTDQKTPTALMPTIALDGYCPVSLAQKAKWVKGSTDISTEYEGIIFRFASEEGKVAFAANPELYAPVLRGIDVVELLTNRRETTGSRKFGAWYHGRVFLFVNADNYEKFQNNPELYAFLANQSQSDKALASTRTAAQRPVN